MYDIIGDVHGHAAVLKELLKKLGYTQTGGAYRHPERKTLFVGDYIDRGPQVRETLHLVSSMVEAGQAIALMGNHEFNAIMYNEPDGDGEYLRRHSEKNKDQHESTLKDFEGRKAEYYSFINWFKKLPVYFESDNFRAIHACWDTSLLEELQSYLDEKGVLKPEYFSLAGDQDSRLYELIETLLKGKEVKLPDNLEFSDKGGHKRDEARIKWWLDPGEVSFGEWTFTEGLKALENRPVDPAHLDTPFYPEQFRPVFFGHYWLRGKPELQCSNVCCLDYSIGKEDKLVAYRFDGENSLEEERLVWVDYE